MRATISGTQHATPSQPLSRVRMACAGNDFWYPSMQRLPNHLSGRGWLVRATISGTPASNAFPTTYQGEDGLCGQRFLVPQYEAPAQAILALRAQTSSNKLKQSQTTSHFLNHHQALQILPFRKINRHRVIRRPLQPLTDIPIYPSISSRRRHNFVKQIGTDSP